MKILFWNCFNKKYDQIISDLIYVVFKHDNIHEEEMSIYIKRIRGI